MESEATCSAQVALSDPREALRELAERGAAGLLRLARRLVGDVEEARDLVQDALLAAHRSLGSFRGESSVRRWVYRILLHEGLKRIRRKRLNRRLRSWLRLGDSCRRPAFVLWGQGEPADPEQVAARREQAEMVNRILAKLSARQHTVFVLRFLEGLSVEEIAELTGMGPGTVKTHLVRALHHVRRPEAGGGLP